MAYEAFWDGCTLACRFDVAPPIDDKGATVSLSGSAEVSAAWSDSSAASLHLDETGTGAAFVPTDVFAGVAAGAFTLCFSFMVSSTSGASQRIVWRAGGGFEIVIYLGRIIVNLPADEFLWSDVGVVLPDVPYRGMLTRDGSGVFRLFLDGDQVASLTAAINFSALDPSAGTWIGDWEHGGSGIRGGYVDEVFFVPGVALETASHTSYPAFASGGAPSGPTLLLEVEVVSSRHISLPLEVIVSRLISPPTLPLEVMVVSPGVLSGAEQVSDGVTTAGRWQPVVMIDGVDRSDDLAGDVQVTAARGSARIATFAIVAEGAIDLPAMTGRTVTVDIAAPGGTSRMRLFTGVVNLPDLDLASRTISLTCTDNLQIVVDAMPRPVLDEMIGGRWSAAVFDAGVSTWGYAQDRLSTVPASLDLSPYGALRVTPWAAGAVDFYFGADMVIDGSVQVSPAERSGLVNHVDVEFGYRFPRAKREAHNVVFSYLTNGFGPWVNAGNGFLFRSTVLSGIESAGGAVADIEWVALPTTAQLINTGGGGVAPWIPNPVTDPLMCLGFSATVTFDYVQDVDELHKITVYSPASVAAVGLLRETMSGSLVGQTADTLAVETNGRLYQLGLSHIPPLEAPAIVLGQTTAGVLALTADTDRAAADAAIATMVDVAKARIAASHYGTSVSAALALHPLVDLDKTITIEAQGVLATGRVESVEHIMSPDQARAVTQFRLALCRLDGAGVPDIETPTAAPAGVEDGATGLLAPVVCVFNGLVTEDQSFEISFPAVEAAQRDVAEVEITSAFTAALVEDALTIVLED